PDQIVRIARGSRVSRLPEAPGSRLECDRHRAAETFAGRRRAPATAPVHATATAHLADPHHRRSRGGRASYARDCHRPPGLHTSHAARSAAARALPRAVSHPDSLRSGPAGQAVPPDRVLAMWSPARAAERARVAPRHEPRCTTIAPSHSGLDRGEAPLRRAP